MAKSFYVYILECSNGALYTGFTPDLERRYQEHLSGSSKCKYTRSFPPKKIAAFWDFKTDQSLALKIENKIKRLSKTQKLALINDHELIEQLK